MKRTIAFCVTAFAGFLIGAMSANQTPVKAQTQTKVFITYDSSPGIGFTTVPSTQIVGFSCVSESVAGISNPKCYIAYLQ